MHAWISITQDPTLSLQPTESIYFTKVNLCTLHHELDHKSITSLSKIASHGFSCHKQPFVDEHVWCRVRIPPISTLIYNNITVCVSTCSASPYLYIILYTISYEYYDIHCD